jgi:hypothetical protein
LTAFCIILAPFFACLFGWPVGWLWLNTLEHFLYGNFVLKAEWKDKPFFSAP